MKYRCENCNFELGFTVFTPAHEITGEGEVVRICDLNSDSIGLRCNNCGIFGMPEEFAVKADNNG